MTTGSAPEKKKKELPPIDVLVKMRGIGGYKRHVFLCTGPKCCAEEVGLSLWETLKERLADLGLANASVFRTKAGCLRICQEGPILLVYPEGTWYRQVDATKLERIIQEHLVDGRPVEEYAFAHNPL